jgi:hypothetical protein
MLRLLAAKYLISSPESPIVPLSKRAPLYRSGEFSVYPFPGLPRAYLVSRAVVSEDEAQTLQILRDNNFDPQTTVLLEQSPAQPLVNGTERGDAEIVVDSPAKVVVKTHAREPSALVLLDNYYPGWKALVDGNETEILRANYLFRAVSLPPGEHTVSFLYRPGSFTLGAILSACGALIVLAGLISARRKR